MAARRIIAASPASRILALRCGPRASPTDLAPGVHTVMPFTTAITLRLEPVGADPHLSRKTPNPNAAPRNTRTPTHRSSVARVSG